MAELSLFISDALVEVSCELREVHEALVAAWARCRSPLLAPVRSTRLFAGRAADGYCVRVEGGRARQLERREDVLPVLESAIYARLPDFHRGRVVLHAACLRRGAQVVLLAGRSGAGKSSLALEAIRRGFEYFTDELTVTDGERIWGVPRSLQFEPGHAEQVLPAWLHDVRRDLYPLRLDQGHAGALPLFTPPEALVARAPAPASQVRLFAIERAEQTRCEALDPFAALALLHEAAFEPPCVDLGALLGPGRAHRLCWREPSSALDQIEALL